MTDIKRILFFLLGVSILYKVTKKMGGKLGVSNAMSNLIKEFEGLKLNAYLDTSNIWTIGYGLIRYPNGQKVKKGDKITQEQANEYFKQTLQKFAQEVEDMIKSKVNNNQFAALVSFAYNVGTPSLKKSTLLKLVNENPNNPLIRNEFNKWIYSKGKITKGLQKRRELEANLYFS
jgi:lysozyme